MSYPKTGNEVYVSFNLSNTMLSGIGKGTITREDVSADYLKDLFAQYGVVVAAKPEQTQAPGAGGTSCTAWSWRSRSRLKLFQLSEKNRRLVIITVQVP